MKKSYKIQVDCANCANKMEMAINKIEVVKNATINFMMMKLVIDFDENVNEKELIKEIVKKCKKIDGDFELYY